MKITLWRLYEIWLNDCERKTMECPEKHWVCVIHCIERHCAPLFTWITRLDIPIWAPITLMMLESCLQGPAYFINVLQYSLLIKQKPWYLNYETDQQGRNTSWTLDVWYRCFLLSTMPIHTQYLFLYILQFNVILLGTIHLPLIALSLHDFLLLIMVYHTY